MDWLLYWKREESDFPICARTPNLDLSPLTSHRMILAGGNLIIIYSATSTNHNTVLSGPSPHVSKPKIKIQEIIFLFPNWRNHVQMGLYPIRDIPAPPHSPNPLAPCTFRHGKSPTRTIPLASTAFIMVACPIAHEISLNPRSRSNGACT